MQSKPELLQGVKIMPKGIDSSGIDSIPLGQVAVLSSGYGIEGVFSKVEILDAKIAMLRGFRGYRDEELSVLMADFDSIT